MNKILVLPQFLHIHLLFQKGGEGHSSISYLLKKRFDIFYFPQLLTASLYHYDNTSGPFKLIS